ncbi:MAG: MerR family transcriptional regulator [Sphingomonadales bacterium]|nr:MerR family transcriptional regulator [Sphingomonadales bacterium]
MAGDSGKSPGAMLTIGELSAELGLPTHILRYWETKFDQLTPLKRSGNRRYYRPEDVALAHRIDDLLNRRGFTVRGAQNELQQRQAPADRDADRNDRASGARAQPAVDLHRLKAVRDRLASALAAA